jgi:hypothetical protein
VVVIRQVADRFADAELALRRALLGANGQAAVEKVLADAFAKGSDPETSLGVTSQ